MSAIAEGDCVYNTGGGSKIPMLHKDGIQFVGSNSPKALGKKDQTRRASASGKVIKDDKAWRLNRKKRPKEDLKVVAMVHYESGAFYIQDVKTAENSKKVQLDLEGDRKLIPKKAEKMIFKNLVVFK